MNNHTNIEEFKLFHDALTTDRPYYQPWYFLLNGLEKDPLEGQGWKAAKHQLSFDAASRALEMGYNVGIAGTDEDGLVIIDVDDEDAFKDHVFPDTLTARSSSRKGVHYFFWTDDKNAKVNIALEHKGEIRSDWQYVVAPGSYAKLSDSKDEHGNVTKTAEQKLNDLPDEQKAHVGKYTLENIKPIATITYDDFPVAFRAEKEIRTERDKARENKPVQEYVKRGDSNKSALYELEIDDVVTAIPDQGRHPSLFHDSHTGKNTSISGNLLHCWRHQVSHNAISALAVMAGIADCVDAGTGHKHSGSGSSSIDYNDGQTIYNIWQYAKTNRYIPQDDSIPNVAAVWFAVTSGFCKEHDIKEGWMLPKSAFIKVLESHRLYQREEKMIPKEKEEQEEPSIYELLENIEISDNVVENTVIATEFIKNKLNGQSVLIKTAFIDEHIRKHFSFNSVITAELISQMKTDEREKAKRLKLAEKSNEEEHTQQPDFPDHIKEKAKEIMYVGDPVKFILDTHSTLHVGDEPLARALLVSIGIQSVRNSEGIHPKVSGDSGKGKTHCCKTMLHLLPKEYKFNTTLSDRAIYYMDIQPSSVIFSDDVDLSDTLQGIIKRATSNFQDGDTYTTLDKNLNKRELTIPPRIAWWLTSVDDDQSIQLLNRQFGGGVDESKNQDMAVLEFQKNLLMSGEVGLPENDSVSICRCLIQDIKEQLYKVLIPYSINMKWIDVDNRRNFMIFADIIRAFAVLRHRQRYHTDEGDLIADIEDYNDAKDLYIGRAKNQGTKLTDVELKFCNILHTTGELDFAQLQRAMGVSQGRISQIINGKGKGDTGLINKVKGLTIETQNVKTDSNTTVRKKVCSLHDFNPFDHFESVITLKTGTEEWFNEYYPPITKILPEKNALPLYYITYITINNIIYSNKVIEGGMHPPGNILCEKNENGVIKVINSQPIAIDQGNIGGKVAGNMVEYYPENQKTTGNMEPPKTAQLQIMRYISEFKKANYAMTSNVDPEQFTYEFCQVHEHLKTEASRIKEHVIHMNVMGWK